MDRTERMIWFDTYLQEGMRAAPPPVCYRTYLDIHAWARSMAAIAEQFIDNDDREAVDAE